MMMAILLALFMLAIVPAMPQAEAAEECVPGHVYTVPAQYESDDTIDWGPTLVIWGCIIVFAVGVTLFAYSRVMAWIRKWG